MQVNIRCLIESKRYPGSYINRMVDGLTNDLTAGLRFHNESEASEWLLNSIYAPEDKENYTYALIEITTKRKETEHEQNQAL